MSAGNIRWAWVLFVLLWIVAPAAAASLDGSGEVPESWLATVSDEIRAAEYRFARTDDGALAAPNRAAGLRSRFDEHGLRVGSRRVDDPAEWQFELRLIGFGRGGELAPIDPVEPLADDNRVRYLRPGLVEWYVNDVRGLEQGFDIPASPAGSGDLVLEMGIDGLKAYPSDDRASVLFKSAGRTVLRYGGLKVLDATERLLPAGLTFGPDRMRIVVDDHDAVYPIVVDPLMTSPDATLEINQTGAQFGLSVATAGDVNGDGFSDLIVGAPAYNTTNIGAGRADLYLGGPGGFSTTPDWTSFGEDRDTASFGWSVACAGDVNGDGFHDVIVGAKHDHNLTAREGKIFVFHGSATGLSAVADWTAESNTATARLGGAVSTAGDVNADGYDDIIAGAFTYSDGEFEEGAVFVWLGGASGLGSDGTPTNADWRAYGDQVGAQFGFSVATAGDVDGDGYDDVVVGAPSYDSGQTDEGAAFIWLGGPGGLGADGSPANADWMAQANLAGSLLGYTVSTTGDLDGDGYADVIAGAPTYNATGRAFVWHGSATGPVASATPTNADWIASNGVINSWFGLAVATAGDVNGDGYADVVVGKTAQTTGGGHAYAWFGGPAGLGVDGTPTNADWTAQDIPATDSGFAVRFGYSVATAGDVNGDGFSDVVVGSPFADTPEIDSGQAFVYLGFSSGLSATSKWAAQPDQDDAHLGVSVTTAGDINGDGYSDVVVGAPDYDSGQTDEGAIFVYHGSRTGLSAASDWHAESNQAGARLGQSVASVGDVNGDGFSDLAAGAYLFDQGQTDEGAVFVWYGSKSGMGPTGTPANADWSLDGNQADAWFGHAVAAAGDVNGDGVGDIIVGAPMFDDASTDDGRATIYHGSTSGPSTTADWTKSGPLIQSKFGWAVASAGDTNGNGYSDVIVGALEDQSGQTEEGRAYVYVGFASGVALLPFWTGEANQAFAQFGASVGSAGDVNGDGYSDIIVGAPRYDDGQLDEGSAFVWLGGSTGMTGGGSGTPLNAAWKAQIDQAGAEFGSAVAAAGDLNGDGYGDVVVGGKLVNYFTLDDGGAFVWLGSATGLGVDGTWANSDWSTGANQVSAHFGSAVAGAGDVNGDGFGDLIVGSENWDFIEIDEGHALTYYGNAGGGLDVQPLQHLVGKNDVVHFLSKSDDDFSFRIGALGRTPAGRGRVRLEWEAKPVKLTYNGAGQRRGTFEDSGAPDPSFGSAVPLIEAAINLRSGTPYHWRARIQTDSPFFPHSPWFSLPYNSIQQTVIRTGGFPDLDGDGAQSNTDCNDSDSQVWSLPGQVGMLVVLGDKRTFDWAAPADPGGTAPVYDTVRSIRPFDFVSGGVTCVETNDGSDTEAVDFAIPVSGRLWSYLVRAENSCGLGALGPGSSGSPRTMATCP